MRIYGITGWKNTGKTTLTERLVAAFVGRGLSVSTIKHAHHAVDVDQPGTDSFRHRSAGAGQVILASASRWALMNEQRDAPEPTVEELIARLDPVDIVLIEGYKTAPHPKIETSREVAGRALIAPNNPSIRAVAADYAAPTDLPVFDLDDVESIADFIVKDTAS
ncbi:molybdopterin-guanine dinucleotide biosynthesis protein B [uncultured Shimia sp.]|uniref:molybdopterin-guanine dinucleotide biosynthesis protein B n=1 Tax=uncultured Shimia sp. TaxID=573152 RepID=UPI00261DC8ED|nr:molybdopterin-guanine dinucleotide biosynthesis protein B [uncultured Shimia sp.]